MRVVFMGASELGFDCCKAILDANHNLVGIFTIPQRFDIKYKDQTEKVQVRNYLFKDFRSFESAGVPVVVVEDKMSAYYDELKRMQPDLILAIGWYYMIPQQMIDLASKGAVGIHGSLLPKYRGNAPFVWAMINGEKETGVSLFYFEKGVDEGDIIAQGKIIINDADTIKEVLEKAKEASIRILLEYLPQLKDGIAPRIPQDHSQATIFPKRAPEDGKIDWSWDAARIKNFIRAQTKPYPGAFIIVNDKKVVIWDADILSL
jgi:methionyl-tRNA formyltransferase